jgi:hypothetical protein
MFKYAIYVLATVCVASVASASTIGFTGTFTADDDNVVFHYTVLNAGSVDISTTSFATGGFIPILSLFDSTGNFLFLDSGYASSADAHLSWVSDANTDYIVALTQYDNFPVLAPNNNLSDGFTEDGQPDFTELLSGFPGPFRDPIGTQLTGDWAVNFTSAEPLDVYIPEPSTTFLALTGALLMFWRRHAARQQS